MNTQTDIPKEPLPPAFLTAIFLSAGFMAFVAWDQSHWWQAKEDYSFGWLAPAFVAYIIYDRWEKISKHAQRVARENSPHSELARIRFSPPIIWTIITIIAGALLFAIGAMYRAAAGPSFAGTFAITIGMSGIVLGAIYFTAPARCATTRLAVADRRLVAGLFLFPAFVWLVSAPMITVVENNLNVFLMRQVTHGVFFVFDLLGLPLEQRGNVLILPSGSVGVAEACSGIRSLTGCLFSATFLAAAFLDSWWRKIVLVLASLVFAFAANLLRSLFLTSWAYRYGASAIEGTVHDISGYSVLGMAVVGLVCLLPLLKKSS